ncbi:right-handed parallel beta-helix repeat-containing protein [Capnocytophaga canimorsus]|uniref:right-handed parallel beta-helix repeat-containing protein n=1 Tax=Capnocytophaga canimorsus TaxID=28188 RepID=UPI0037D3E3AC
MKNYIYSLTMVLLVGMIVPAQAQILNRLAKKVTDKVEHQANKTVDKTTDRATQKATEKGNNAKSETSAGKTYYVSATKGSVRADGLSKDKPLKDLQKAIDLAEEGDVILVAEGNYLGNMDRGYIECGKFGNGADNGKFLKFYGGYSSDFSERNPVKYITKIQPNASIPKGIGSALFHITARRAYGDKRPAGEVVVDGFTFDGGEYILYYKPDVKDPRTGTPNAEVETGMLVHPDALAGNAMGVNKHDWRALHLTVEGNVKVQNCVFVNCRNFGLQGGMGAGHIEVSNNVFVANRYAACEIWGTLAAGREGEISFDFHHNTVLFSWPITKEFETMGQGFRFMNGIRTINVYNNIFAFNSRCGVERCRYENKKELEKLKQSNLYDNYFLGNMYDLEICDSSRPINVPASRIEEAEEIGPKYEGNKEMPFNKAFIAAIDAPYLKGFTELKISTTESYDANSSANQLNRFLGLNQQGTSTTRVTMFANRYPWQKARNLFGVVKGYGAQEIK